MDDIEKVLKATQIIKELDNLIGSENFTQEIFDKKYAELDQLKKEIRINYMETPPEKNINIYHLAEKIDNFFNKYDTYEYQDSIGTDPDARHQHIEDIYKDIESDNINNLVTTLNDFLYDAPQEEIEIVHQLLQELQEISNQTVIKPEELTR